MNFGKQPPSGKKVDNSVIDNNAGSEVDTEEIDAEILDSEIVDLDNKINDEQKTATIDFQSQDDIDNILKAKTKDSTFKDEEKSANKFNSLDAEEIRDEIKNEESKASEKYTYEDFANIAAFLLTLYDTGLSTGLSAWAKDVPSAYEMPKEKKRILEHQLTLILIKYQQKFSLEFMFFCTLALVSYMPVAKAIKRKKDIKAWEANRKNKPEKEKESEKKVDKEMGKFEEIKENPFLRKKGKQSKKII